MNKLYKFISIILIISILFSACGTNSTDKATVKIEEYLKNNQYNECLQYINELETDIKNQITSSALSLISAEYNELINESNISLDDYYALNLIDNSFAENCRKLWNIAKLFSISSDNENYTDFVYLHYYAEMCNYTKYSEIYSLLESVHKSDYLKQITDAMYAYDNEGNQSLFDTAYKSAALVDCSKFNPQEYLIEDYEAAHISTVKALKSLCNGFATSNVTVIASSFSDLENALSSILYITDTINAIHSKQIYIFNELSSGNINTVFNTDIDVAKREYSVGVIFPLDSIFGENTVSDNNDTSHSENDNKISKAEALKIAVDAINKTKSYQNQINVSYTQTKNIQLTAFENGSSINDAVDLTKTAITNALEDTNGTYKADIPFKNGTNGKISLDSLIPPSDKKATGNEESIQSYNVVSGTAGYVISITFLPEATTKTSEIKGIGSIINGFSFENSENVSDYKSTYTTANVMLTVNNNGLLEQMEYAISGLSDCRFTDDNKEFLFEAQFTFYEKYTYSFEY